MPAFKCIMEFRAPQNGWSELLYRQGDGLTAQGIRDVMIANNGVCDKRIACMAPSFYLRTLKIINVDPPRDCVFVSFLGDSGRGTFGAAGDWGVADGSEQVQDTINVRVFAGTQHWRSYLLGGLPPGAFQPNGDLRPAGQWINAMKNYFKKIIGTFQIQTFTPTLVSTIVGFAKVGDRITSITLNANWPNVQTGAIIAVKGAYGITGANRQYRVSLGSATPEIGVRPGKIANFGTLAAGTGRGYTLATNYPQMSDYGVVGPTSRRRGRFSGTQRGSRSVRRS